MSPSDTIDSVWPDAAPALTDEDFLTALDAERALDAGPTWLSVNFVSSLDGAATTDGQSGGLSRGATLDHGGAADKRVFDLLRWPSDVVLVGAGTVRVEGYGALRLDAPASEWRLRAGLSAHPVFAIVSGRLDLDPESKVFTDAPVRPIVLTTARADGARRSALSRVADVVDCGDHEVEAGRLVDALAARGLRRIHSEGGPSLFGTLVAADVIDELSLTLSPLVELGNSGRITAHADYAGRRMRLASIQRSADTLLLRYRRPR